MAHPNPMAQRDIRAQACQPCGADVSGLSQIACQTCDDIEIPATGLTSRASRCGAVFAPALPNTSGRPPADMPGGPPFGPNLRARLKCHTHFW